MGVSVGQSFQARAWLFSSQKTIFSRSLSEEKTEWAWRSCGILSEPKQPPLAAFYPYHRSSRGGLSFSSTVGQNGEPSAFSCRDNILSQQNKAGERQKRWDWRWNYFPYKILPPIPTVKLKKTVRACQQTTEQNNDANGGGQSPNSSNTGRWDSVSKAQYVKTKQIFLMKSNISCQKASKLLTIILYFIHCMYFHYCKM